MPTALFLSPHLDDAGFLLCRYAAEALSKVPGLGRVPLHDFYGVRCRTRQASRCAARPTKALRRKPITWPCAAAKMTEFAQIVGVTDVRHWPFAEAPHRGYESLLRSCSPGFSLGDEDLEADCRRRVQDLVSALDPSCWSLRPRGWAIMWTICR